MSWAEEQHPRDDRGRFVNVERQADPVHNAEGKDWFSKENIQNMPDYERLSEKMDSALEALYRQENPETGEPMTKDEAWDYYAEHSPNTRGPKFEAARQDRVLTELTNPKTGQAYDTWTAVPPYITIYRGSSKDEGSLADKSYENFSLNKEVSKDFAGESGVVREYVVHKNDIEWINAPYATGSESEVIVSLPGKRVFEKKGPGTP